MQTTVSLDRLQRNLAASTAALLLLCVASPAFGADKNVADTELADRIKQSFAGIEDLPADSVKVAVRSGTVLITGRVPLLEHSLRVEQNTWRVKGVVDIENELRVAPRLAVSDAEITRRISSLVESDPRFLAAKTKTQVQDGEVTLSGYFLDPRDILDLKHQIAALDGVLSILIDADLLA
jgi:osmotically-inducible protein OsmY